MVGAGPPPRPTATARDTPLSCSLSLSGLFLFTARPGPARPASSSRSHSREKKMRCSVIGGGQHFVIINHETQPSAAYTMKGKKKLQFLARVPAPASFGYAPRCINMSSKKNLISMHMLQHHLAQRYVLGCCGSTQLLVVCFQLVAKV